MQMNVTFTSLGHGVTVSVDLNFRKKLWTSEKAISVMRPLMKYVDVCMGNEEDAQLCLGFKPDADVEGGKTDAEGLLRNLQGHDEGVRIQVCCFYSPRISLCYTQGCILVGENKFEGMVVDSRIWLQRLINAMVAARDRDESIWITIQ